MKEVPDELASARRSLDGLQGVVNIGQWYFFKDQWCLEIGIEMDGPATLHIPKISRWVIVSIDNLFQDRLEVHPAIIDGIDTTFWHQRFNTTKEGVPYRTGNLCLRKSVEVFQRFNFDEPNSIDERVVWLVGRLFAWVNAAATNSLVSVGDPFELPDFAASDTQKCPIAYLEKASQLASWSNSVEYGLAEILFSSSFGVINSFYSIKNEFIVNNDWNGPSNIFKQQRLAVWLKLHEIPIFDPWKPPENWGQLKDVLSKKGIDVSSILFKVIKKESKAFRNDKPIILLLGMPIPVKVGGPPSIVHWQSVLLPKISQVKTKGFRNSPESLRFRDESICLTDEKDITWQRSENWSEANLTVRGKFANSISEKMITIVGVGSLGSSIAEMLVRAGCNKILLIDQDTFDAGNTARHVLDIASIGSPKVEALMKRLEHIRPNVRVEAVYSDIQSIGQRGLGLLEKTDVIIDATANNSVLRWVETSLKSLNFVLFSFSFSYGANELFCYGADSKNFSYHDFYSSLLPWLSNDQIDEADLVQEGIGCWNPVFPARSDDVWAFACVAIKWLEKWFNGKLSSNFQVFEKSEDDITIKPANPI